MNAECDERKRISSMAFYAQNALGSLRCSPSFAESYSRLGAVGRTNEEFATHELVVTVVFHVTPGSNAMFKKSQTTKTSGKSHSIMMDIVLICCGCSTATKLGSTQTQTTNPRITSIADPRRRRSSRSGWIVICKVHYPPR